MLLQFLEHYGNLIDYGPSGLQLNSIEKLFAGPLEVPSDSRHLILYRRYAPTICIY